MIAIKPFNLELVPAGAALKQAAAVEFVKQSVFNRDKLFVFLPLTRRKEKKKKKKGAFEVKGGAGPSPCDCSGVSQQGRIPHQSPCDLETTNDRKPHGIPNFTNWFRNFVWAKKKRNADFF